MHLFHAWLYQINCTNTSVCVWKRGEGAVQGHVCLQSLKSYNISEGV